MWLRDVMRDQITAMAAKHKLVLRDRAAKRRRGNQPIFTLDGVVILGLKHLATGNMGDDLESGAAPKLTRIVIDVFSDALLATFPHALEWMSLREQYVSAYVFARRKAYSSLPGAVCSVDGQHCRVSVARNEATGLMYGRKGNSHILHVFTDALLNFRDVQAGATGRMGDAMSIRRSVLWSVEGPLHRVGHTPSLCLGDGAYPTIDWIMLTKKDTKLSRRVATSRNSVERAFGILAHSFKGLRQALMDRHFSSRYVLCACTLHNLRNAFSGGGLRRYKEWTEQPQQLPWWAPDFMLKHWPAPAGGERKRLPVPALPDLPTTPTATYGFTMQQGAIQCLHATYGEQLKKWRLGPVAESPAFRPLQCEDDEGDKTDPFFDDGGLMDSEGKLVAEEEEEEQEQEQEEQEEPTGTAAAAAGGTEEVVITTDDRAKAFRLREVYRLWVDNEDRERFTPFPEFVRSRLLNGGAF